MSHEPANMLHRVNYLRMSWISLCKQKTSPGNHIEIETVSFHGKLSREQRHRYFVGKGYCARAHNLQTFGQARNTTYQTDAASLHVHKKSFMGLISSVLCATTVSPICVGGSCKVKKKPGMYKRFSTPSTQNFTASLAR